MRRRAGIARPAWWDVETGTRLLTLEGSRDALYDVAFSPDGRRIATGGLDHAWRLWDATTGKMLATVEGGSEAVTSVAFSPDGLSLLTASQDRTVRVWSLAPDRRPGAHSPRRLGGMRCVVRRWEAACERGG